MAQSVTRAVLVHKCAVSRVVTSIVSTCVCALVLTGPVWASDTTKSAVEAINKMANITPQEALREGAKAYYSGEKERALSPLRFAAENGQAMAAWKLGRMYAQGDGVAEDDVEAFRYFSKVVREYSADGPGSSSAPFVASALVELGNYFLTGIDDSRIERNSGRARELFTYAASYFRDADAQYYLGVLYLDKTVPDHDMRLAARWLKLAAVKGHVGAQAKFGELLYFSEELASARMTGLKWMTLARQQVSIGGAHDWIIALHEKAFALASEQERRNSAQWAENWLSSRQALVSASN